MTVTPPEFEMQVRFLRAHYDVVPLSRIMEAVRGSDAFPPDLAAITFDDGWRDVYEHAFPILRAHQAPATLFVTSAFANGGTWFWEVISTVRARAAAP